MTITAAQVKELRERTGAGMMDCKEALRETGGDLEAASDALRKKGLAKAARRAGRDAREGAVAIAIEGAAGAVAEVNCETDFVARSDDFQALAREAARAALASGASDPEALAAAPDSSGAPLSERVSATAARVGENVRVSRVARIEAKGGAVVGYVHSRVSEGVGAIGVLAAVRPAGVEAARGLAMHVAASAPLSVDRDGLDAALVARERSVQEDIARGEGKPEAMLEKIVEGRMRRFFEAHALLEQPWVMEPKRKVGEVLKESGAEVDGFVRFALGEGADA